MFDKDVPHLAHVPKKTTDLGVAVKWVVSERAGACGIATKRQAGPCQRVVYLINIGLCRGV